MKANNGRLNFNWVEINGILVYMVWIKEVMKFKTFCLVLNYYCHSLNFCYYYCNFFSIYISLELLVHFTLKMAEATAETCNSGVSCFSLKHLNCVTRVISLLALWSSDVVSTVINESSRTALECALRSSKSLFSPQTHLGTYERPMKWPFPLNLRNAKNVIRKQYITFALIATTHRQKLNLFNPASSYFKNFLFSDLLSLYYLLYC